MAELPKDDTQGEPAFFLDEGYILSPFMAFSQEFLGGPNNGAIELMYTIQFYAKSFILSE